MASNLGLLEDDELLTWMAETPDYLAKIQRLDAASPELPDDKDIVMTESAGCEPELPPLAESSQEVTCLLD